MSVAYKEWTRIEQGNEHAVRMYRTLTLYLF